MVGTSRTSNSRRAVNRKQLNDTRTSSQFLSSGKDTVTGKRARHRPRSTLFTIGHSNRPLDDLLALLKQYGVTEVIDVRAYPRSATNPQFNRATLPRRLRRIGIAYLHLPELGGRRRPRSDSPNSAWQNRSFQGYADYMQTPAFAEGLEKVLAETK